ncbi:hypothetical protein [Zestomonas carbonaria]|uniref:Uncharacterized protein n=1 Tax=Zestomonas carbonaria TaxID=2762745 RepID=A0A7U7I7E4_9GAMM|nr:hypothetical protein [Pseudomonas carbonaria]CAD5106194.1 hypothetical protein PSEWESI4_00454 [Pseudomonas carbonaria]
MKFGLEHIAFALLAALLSIFTLAAAAVYWATPTMIVRNNSGATVQVTARWGDHHRELGDLQPGSKRTFNVRGESAIRFIVTYSDGSQLESLPMYFTTAMTVSAVISGQSVSVSAEL